MLEFKIIIAIVLFIGLLGILVVIGAGELKTKEDTINDIEEEVKCLAEIEKQKQSASVLIDQKDKEIQKLLEKIEEQRQELSKSKVQHQKTRNYSSQDMSEFETRKRFIDADLRMLGWEFSQNRKRNCVEIELEVHGMPKPESSDGKGTGYA